MTDVGHRALVAYERDRDRYDLHYSHWGAAQWRLATAITPDQSFGQCDGTRDGQTVAVDPAPIATDCTFDAILRDHLDFQQYEGFYRVTSGFDVEPWLVCWFGLPSVDTNRPKAGAIVAVDGSAVTADGEFIRGRFSGTKTTVCALLDRGLFDPETARAFLAETVQSWRGDGRTVRLSPVARTTLDRDQS